MELKTLTLQDQVEAQHVAESLCVVASDDFSGFGNFWPLTFWTNKVKVQHSCWAQDRCESRARRPMWELQHQERNWRWECSLSFMIIYSNIYAHILLWLLWYVWFLKSWIFMFIYDIVYFLNGLKSTCHLGVQVFLSKIGLFFCFFVRCRPGLEPNDTITHTSGNIWTISW